MNARVVTLGETMALMTSEQLGPLQHTASLALGIGGAESNVAIGLRRLGVPARWIGKIGDGLNQSINGETPHESVPRKRQSTKRCWLQRLGGGGRRPGLCRLVLRCGCWLAVLGIISA